MGFTPEMTAGGESPALVISHAVVAYGRLPVLEGIHGDVQPGESVALVGPNGAGKTTLIRAILGLVPLISGSVTVLGRSPSAARADVAYVPQADALDPEFPVSAGQVVVMGRYRRVGWLRRPGHADREIARRALEEVGLADRAGHRFGMLSGGQRQRVALARAIAQEARLLLLDEPLNGVDAATQDLVLAALSRLRAQGAAVVMSTHDLSLAHLACDEACLLNRHQFAFAPVAEALTPELLRATYGDKAVLLAGDRVIVARP